MANIIWWGPTDCTKKKKNPPLDIKSTVTLPSDKEQRKQRHLEEVKLNKQEVQQKKLFDIFLDRMTE